MGRLKIIYEAKSIQSRFPCFFKKEIFRFMLNGLMKKSRGLGHGKENIVKVSLSCTSSLFLWECTLLFFKIFSFKNKPNGRFDRLIDVHVQK